MLTPLQKGKAKQLQKRIPCFLYVMGGVYFFVFKDKLKIEI